MCALTPTPTISSCNRSSKNTASPPAALSASPTALPDLPTTYLSNNPRPHHDECVFCVRTHDFVTCALTTFEDLVFLGSLGFDSDFIAYRNISAAITTIESCRF